MGDLLDQLTALLETNFKDQAPFDVKSVRIAGDFELDSVVTKANLPTIILTPVGEPTTEDGPMGNTVTVRQQIRCRAIMAWSSQPNTKREGTAGVFALSDAIRQVLATNKRLGKSGNYLNGLDPIRPTNDLDIIADGNYVGRDLVLSYSRMEDWEGPFNDQTTLELPG